MNLLLVALCRGRNNHEDPNQEPPGVRQCSSCRGSSRPQAGTLPEVLQLSPNYFWTLQRHFQPKGSFVSSHPVWLLRSFLSGSFVDTALITLAEPLHRDGRHECRAAPARQRPAGWQPEGHGHGDGDGSHASVLAVWSPSNSKHLRHRRADLTLHTANRVWT